MDRSRCHYASSAYSNEKTALLCSIANLYNKYRKGYFCLQQIVLVDLIRFFLRFIYERSWGDQVHGIFFFQMVRYTAYSSPKRAHVPAVWTLYSNSLIMVHRSRNTTKPMFLQHAMIDSRFRNIFRMQYIKFHPYHKQANRNKSTRKIPMYKLSWDWEQIFYFFLACLLSKWQTKEGGNRLKEGFSNVLSFLGNIFFFLCNL